MEDDLRWKTPSMEDDLRWKTTFDGRRPLMEDDLRWKTTLNGRQPSMEDDPQVRYLNLCSEPLKCTNVNKTCNIDSKVQFGNTKDASHHCPSNKSNL